ncbi:BtrH N-terminal domain-containing protein [bacterium]|nr:BtrH N-terminal domain-containing protein [bacterium]
MNLDFTHRQTAHCESGTIANLMLNRNFDISESLAFGIGSGLFFAYVPFVKVNFLPITAFRIFPWGIYKKAASRLNVKIKTMRFRNQQKAMNAIDELLDQGIPIGAQVGVFWLPYFPPALRFHFNTHLIVICGKNGDEYTISDPVGEFPVTCHRKDLMKARFALGFSAPKGRISYLLNDPDPSLIPKAIVTGMKETCKNMLNIPYSMVGVKGIRSLAKRLKDWPEKYGQEKANSILGQIVRMQEEIGTGGAGFRYIYADFLQEAAGILKKDELFKLSERLTETGDLWRDFAVGAARNCKRRATENESYPHLAEILLECADREEGIFTDLKKQITR